MVVPAMFIVLEVVYRSYEVEDCAELVHIVRKKPNDLSIRRAFARGDPIGCSYENSENW